MWIEGTGHREGWPERVAWASFSSGLLGLLLVCLLVWVETLDPHPSQVEPAARGAVAVSVERARAEGAVPRREPAVTVPLAAILRTREGLAPYCFVLEAGPRGGVARARRLELGAVAGRRVVVRSGLEPGEPVLVRGQHEVVDGSTLWVQDARLDPWPVAARASR
ncbi:MAG: hypothetical protein ACQGVK_17240 [Myxococcota bacterium]